MPSILYHQAFAELVFPMLKERFANLNEIKFYTGNQIPDRVADKNATHLFVPTENEWFWAPDIKRIKKMWLDITDSVKLGIYTHLYLDHAFITQFLLKEYEYDIPAKEVIFVRKLMDKKILDSEIRIEKKFTISKDQFFSDAGLYGAYTEINGELLKNKKVTLQHLYDIPEELPKVGIKEFDEFKPGTWKAELMGYLAQYFAENRSYTGRIIEFKSMWGALENIAKQFTKEFD